MYVSLTLDRFLQFLPHSAKNEWLFSYLVTLKLIVNVNVCMGVPLVRVSPLTDLQRRVYSAFYPLPDPNDKSEKQKIESDTW